MTKPPLFVELCAGTAALSLRLASRHARPPVSRMGAKTGYANAILRAMGLRAGLGADAYLWCEPDPGCRLLLHAYTDAELAKSAADIIRGWKDEDPRALWERLRAEGPARCEVVEAREVARWLTGQRLTIPQAQARGAGPSDFNGGKPQSAAGQVADLLRATGIPATITPDALEIDPMEVAGAILTGVWSYRQSEPDSGYIGPGERRQDTSATATATATATARVAGLCAGATVLPDARPIEPIALPPGTVAFIDPPYVGTTGYAADLPRDEVCTLAERWASAGALVVISEAEPIEALGWHHVEITGERVGQKRTFSKQQREWLTMSRAPGWTPAVQVSMWGAA